MAGPTGCGLCGIEMIAEAMRPTATIGHGGQFSPEQIMAAMEGLPSRQRLNMETPRFTRRPFGLSRAVSLRCGKTSAVTMHSISCQVSLARASIVAREGIGLLTSRVSVEMVQKTAAIGAPAMVSVSAPTALAVRMADAAGITLAAIARADGFRSVHPSV